MERDERWLFVCDQLCEPRRSWSTWSPGLHGVVASAQSEPDCHQITGSPFKTFADAENACDTMFAYLTKNA
jgi:hypothetical protein